MISQRNHFDFYVILLLFDCYLFITFVVIHSYLGLRMDLYRCIDGWMDGCVFLPSICFVLKMLTVIVIELLFWMNAMQWGWCTVRCTLFHLTWLIVVHKWDNRWMVLAYVSINSIHWSSQSYNIYIDENCMIDCDKFEVKLKMVNMKSGHWLTEFFWTMFSFHFGIHIFKFIVWFFGNKFTFFESLKFIGNNL